MEVDLRRAEVSGDRETLLRLRFRAGRGVPITLGGEPCHTATVDDADPVAFARVRAFLGCEVARELVFGKSMPNHSAPRDVLRLYSPPKGLPQWLQALSRLAAALPDVVVSGVACENCGPLAPGLGAFRTEIGDWGYSECEPCNGTGKRDLRVPFAQYLLVVGAVEAGRGAWQKEYVRPAMGLFETCTCPHQRRPHWNSCPVRKALGAAEAWTVCPCPTRRTEWARLTNAQDLPVWVPHEWDTRAPAGVSIRAADTLTGTARADVQRAGLRLLPL